MKKLLLILASVMLLFSCSSDDDNLFDGGVTPNSSAILPTEIRNGNYYTKLSYDKYNRISKIISYDGIKITYDLIYNNKGDIERISQTENSFKKGDYDYYDFTYKGDSVIVVREYTDKPYHSEPVRFIESKFKITNNGNTITALTEIRIRDRLITYEFGKDGRVDKLEWDDKQGLAKNINISNFLIVYFQNPDGFRFLLYRPNNIIEYDRTYEYNDNGYPVVIKDEYGYKKIITYNK